MEKVQILAPPKEVDPRVLAWKGAAVLGKMDGSSELWVTPADWVNVLSSRLVLANQNTGHLGDARAQRTVFLSVIKALYRMDTIQCSY